jgi:hypothetical protein
MDKKEETEEIKRKIEEFRKDLRGLWNQMRPFPHTRKDLFRILNRDKLFDAIGLYAENFSPQSENLVIEWIKVAQEDARASKILHLSGLEWPSLYHLQQGMEKTVKAEAMLFGIITEKECIEYKHNMAGFYRKLIESDFIERTLKIFPRIYNIEFFRHLYSTHKESNKILAPFGFSFAPEIKKKGIEMPSKEDKEKIISLLRGVESQKEWAIKKTLEMDKGLPAFVGIWKRVENFTELKSPEREEVAQRLAKALREDVEKQESKKEVKRFMKKIKLNEEDISGLIKFGIIAAQLSLGTLPLFFLPVLAQIFETSGRYPDARRKLKVDPKNLGAVKSLEGIMNFLNNHLKNLSDFISQFKVI